MQNQNQNGYQQPQQGFQQPQQNQNYQQPQQGFQQPQQNQGYQQHDLVGRVKEIKNKYGTLLSLSFSPADIEKILDFQKRNPSGWVNLSLKYGRSGKPYMEAFFSNKQNQGVQQPQQNQGYVAPTVQQQNQGYQQSQQNQNYQQSQQNQGYQQPQNDCQQPQDDNDVPF